MELPEFGAFKELLKSDSLFRSYFTTHLNLPIFSHRFSYDVSTDTLVSTPPVNSNFHITNKDLMQWVHQVRLPYFWRSPLFVNYQVARQLRTDDYHFLDMDDFLQFKKFLNGGLGYLVLHYCCAVEHLKQLGDEKRRGKLALAILHVFTRDDSRFKLPEQLLNPLTIGLYGRNKPSLEDFETLKTVEVGKMVRCLRQNQQLALRELSGYWLRQFAHSLGGQEEDSNNHKDSRVDEGEEEDDTSSVHEERVSEPSKPLPPMEAAAESGEVDEPPKPDLFQCSIPQPLLPPVSNFSQGCSSELDQLPMEQLNDHLVASLHCDVWAGGPFLAHLQTVVGGAPIVNCLLHWQAVEYLVALDNTAESKRDNPTMEPSLHRYLVPYATTPEELLTKHVKETATKRVRFPPVQRCRLMEALPLGLGKDQLIASQRFVSKLLLKPWQRFLSSDWEKFHQKCVSRPVSSPSLSTIIDDTYGNDVDCNEDMWRAYATAMLSCCHGIIDNLYHHLPVTGLRALVNVAPTEEQKRAERRRRQSSAGWFFRHHIVPPTVTTLAMLTVLSPRKRRCYILCRTLNRNSHTITGKAKVPPRPKTFQELLHDPEHVKCFREFLMLSKKGEDNCIPLDFWLAADRLKKQIGKLHHEGCVTLEEIHKTYFARNADMKLQCGEPIIYELMQLPKVHIFHLLAAQGAVSHSMEERWFQSYLDHLAAQENEDDTDSEEWERQKVQCKERTKGLWRMFARNVISFKRGLRNPATLKHFQKFLMEEVNRALSSNNGPKKVIGNKVVNMLKLHSDLSFWMEMERYRDMADIVTAAKVSGSHCPEDDYIVHRKAHAIVNCFVDSPVHPRIQVNVPSDTVQYILDNIGLGQITRGLFHEATLAIFSGLIYFWKKFCVHRFIPVAKKASSTILVETSTLSVVYDERKKELFEGKEMQLESEESTEGGPILSFSLSRGLRANPGELNRIVNRANVSVSV